MAFEIIYEQERWVGGTPASASLKEFTRLSPNDMRFSGEINDVAGWVWRRTPCLQHEISGFVTITGEPRFDSYLCKVILEKQAEESYRRRNDASRGVAWDVTDQNYRALANGYIRVADSRGPHNKDVDIAAEYQMVIPDGIRTFVSSAGIVGGLHIPPYHFWTMLRDVRRVQVKVEIEYGYSVWPLGGYAQDPSGNMAYTPITGSVDIIKRSGEHLVSEEPEWEPESEET